MGRKLTRHNGRYGKNGVYNSRHNDRRFDVKNSEHIDEDRTKDNIYWDRYGGLFSAENADDRMTFEEVEEQFYEERYRHFTEQQNARNEARRHPENNRTPEDLRRNKKTCPEQSIYQMGTMGDAESAETLQVIAMEFFERFHSLFGEHVHILHWALHLDEATPHIHEVHVFDCENKYGEIAPQQDKALELLGFERPDPSNPTGRFNNRKMTFDATCRTMLFDICKEHGVHLEEEPSYGGREYLEKQDYIRMKQQQEIKSQASKIEQQAINIDRKEEHLEELTSKISHIETMVDEVAETAYQRAVETVVNTVQKEADKRVRQELTNAQKWLQSPDRKGQKKERAFAVDFLEKVKGRIQSSWNNFRDKMRQFLHLPEKQRENIQPVKDVTRKSILAMIREYSSLTAAGNAARNHEPQKKLTKGDLER